MCVYTYVSVYTRMNHGIGIYIYNERVGIALRESTYIGLAKYVWSNIIHKRMTKASRGIVRF